MINRDNLARDGVHWKRNLFHGIDGDKLRYARWFVFITFFHQKDFDF